MYQIEERPPHDTTEVASREKLLEMVQPFADDYRFCLEGFTAWEDDRPGDRVQGVFLQVDTHIGPWCIGAIIRCNDGKLRFWPREEGEKGPFSGSVAFQKRHLAAIVFQMVDQFTAR